MSGCIQLLNQTKWILVVGLLMAVNASFMVLNLVLNHSVYTDRISYHQSHLLYKKSASLQSMSSSSLEELGIPNYNLNEW